MFFKVIYRKQTKNPFPSNGKTEGNKAVESHHRIKGVSLLLLEGVADLLVSDI